ncbi:pilus assembly FimT family protein [Campylobacter sp.]|uniref:pilus assembly FimT family protein n=1 Tax=Campylobacter sp. TaxID=205 RepID=UPI0026F8A937|nr:prepilin-type N-terminal cleavage/methylation domain-containing protein [Campylobacter sp.]
MKKAFTMLELVVVIVVIGILAAMAIPRLERDNLAEAVDQIVSHIRYTQHLAMQDNRFDPNDSSWYKKRWSITFNEVNVCGSKEWRYSIYTDKSVSGNLNSETEVAKDPQNPTKYMSAGWSGGGSFCKNISPKFNIGKTFGIQEVKFSDACKDVQTISFDEFGRPMLSVSTTTTGGVGGAERGYDRILKFGDICKITFTAEKKSAEITITPETGFVIVNYL